MRSPPVGLEQRGEVGIVRVPTPLRRKPMEAPVSSPSVARSGRISSLWISSPADEAGWMLCSW